MLAGLVVGALFASVGYLIARPLLGAAVERLRDTRLRPVLVAPGAGPDMSPG